MRIQRRRVHGSVLWLEVDEEGRALTGAPSLRDLCEREQLVNAAQIAFANSAEAELCAPTAPSKIVCIGLNYRQHAEEMGKALPEVPLIFLKPSTSVLAPGGTIELPPSSEEVHHEGELAVVIGRHCRHVPAERAHEVILGYTIMNDVTARDIQRREKLYTRAKGFDTFAPLGPTIVSDLDPNALRLSVRVNGELRQESGCDDLIFPIPALIAFVTTVMTLRPGDIISTGTPSGVGPLRHGDIVRVAIDGLGALENPVRAATTEPHID